MDMPPATTVMTDLTFPYVNSLTKRRLSDTWADLFSGIGSADCGTVTCKIWRSNTLCNWDYLGTHITPQGY